MKTQTRQFLILALMLTAASTFQMHDRYRTPTSRPDPDWLTIESGFSTEEVSVIRRAASDWHALFNRKRPIRISAFDGKTKPADDIVSGNILEIAGPGHIQVRTNLGSVRLRNTILHAMTHACVGDKATAITNWYSIDNGVRVYAYQGASCILVFDEGKTTLYTKFEESICELLASCFDGYAVEHAGYYALGKLARRYFTNIVVLDHVLSNDVPAIVACIVNKPASNVTGADVYEAMRIYNKAWSEHNSTNK